MLSEATEAILVKLALGICGKWDKGHLYLADVSLTSPLLFLKVKQSFIYFLKNS